MQLLGKWAKYIFPQEHSLISRSLTKPYILNAIEKLRAHYIKNNRLFQTDSRGISMAQVAGSRQTFSKLLVKQLKENNIILAPASIKKINVKNKLRTFYKFNIKDRVVYKILADILTELQEAYLSRNVFSYRKSSSWWDAARSFTGYVRNYRSKTAGIREGSREQGLYVLRTDIKGYTENIPVHAASSIWPLLKNMFTDAGDSGNRAFELLKTYLRPSVYSKSDNIFSPLYGVPFGAPICVLIYNLYIKDLDFLVEKLDPALFYARYGDDFLLAHPDYEIVKKAENLIFEFLKSKELEVGKKKHKIFYFNGAGRRPEGNIEVRGTSVINFLGVSVDFNCMVNLKPSEIRKTKKEIARRLKSFYSCLAPGDREQKIRRMSNFISEIINPEFYYSLPSANMLRKCITNREQLKSIDLFIAQSIAELITNIKGPRAFQSLSYRDLREKYHLPSLCILRNHDKPAKNEQGY